MRTFFTALAFLVMLMAVMPAVRRSIYVSRHEPDRSDPSGGG